MKNGKRKIDRERMLYRSMMEADKAIEDAENMMEDDYEEEDDMDCKKRKCEMGKRKSCK